MARKKKTQVVEENAANAVTMLAASENTSPDINGCAVSVQEKIALLAYTYWEQRGRIGGSPEEDWFRAEQEILGQVSAEG
jgi:hypothetical protein